MFSTNKTLNFSGHLLFRVALFLFFILLFQELKAQPCPTVKAPSGFTVCSGSTKSIVLSSDISGTVFSWKVAQSDVVGAEEGTGTSIICTLTSTDSKMGSAVYTVTPTANGCEGTPLAITIIIMPIPNVTATPLSSTITSGSTSSIVLTSDVAGTAFSWTVIRSAVTGAKSGSGSVIKQILTTADETGIATYSITPDINGCSGNPIDAKVTVKMKQ